MGQRAWRRSLSCGTGTTVLCPKMEDMAGSAEGFEIPDRDQSRPAHRWSSMDDRALWPERHGNGAVQSFDEKKQVGMGVSHFYCLRQLVANLATERLAQNAMAGLCA